MGVLDDWTRDGVYYESMGARLMAKATWLTVPLVRAQVTYRDQHETLPLGEPAQLIGASKQGESESIRFFLAVHTPEWEWNHLERGEAAVFRVRLRTSDGVEREPSQIHRVANDPRFHFLYPYLVPLWIGYEVRFPAVVDGNAFTPQAGSTVTLLLTGTPGHLTLDWHVDR